MKQKINLIFFRYLLIAVLFICVYTFLNWYLIIKLKIYNVRDDAAQIFLPLVLPFIPLLIWLRPRLNLLSFKNARSNSSFGYVMLAAFAIAAPTIITQKYIETATGKLTALKSISDINNFKQTKFYKIENYYIDTEHYGFSYTSTVSGKYNGYLDLHIYFACPMYDLIAPPTTFNSTQPKQIKKTKSILYVFDGVFIDSLKYSSIPKDSIASVKILSDSEAISMYGNDGVNGGLIIKSKNFDTKSNELPPPITADIPKAWLVVHYEKRINNHLIADEKLRLRRQFYDTVIDNFKKRDLKPFVYLKNIGNNIIRDRAENAIKKTSLMNAAIPIVILEPIYESFDCRNGNKLVWIFGAFGIASAAFFLLLLIPKFNEERLSLFLAQN